MKNKIMKTLEEIKKEYPKLRANGFKYDHFDGGDILDHPKEFEAICKWLNDNIGKRKTWTFKSFTIFTKTSMWP